MHNHNGKGDNSMMWMMVLCCALPLIFLLFAGSTMFAGGYVRYIIFGALALTCLWMVFRGPGGHRNPHEDHKMNALGEPETKKKPEHGCCHE